MNFTMIHENYNVSDLDRSIKFYVYASSSFNFETIFSFSPLPVVFNLVSGKSYLVKMLSFIISL
ncbi:hypothetical protein [Eubacterium sp.]